MTSSNGIFSALLALFVSGIQRSPVDSPNGVLMFFSLRLNKLLNKQSRRWWFETPSRSLTHWGRVTHICVSKLTIIASDNGLSSGRWMLLIRLIGTNFNEMLIEILTFSSMKMRLKVSSGKWRPYCLGLNVLMRRRPPIFSRRDTLWLLVACAPFQYKDCLPFWDSHYKDKTVVISYTCKKVSLYWNGLPWPPGLTQSSWWPMPEVGTEFADGLLPIFCQDIDLLED